MLPRSLRAVFVVVALLTLALPVGALAQGEKPGDNAADHGGGNQQRVLQQYGADTWKSFVAMTDPNTGLPTDKIDATTGERFRATSPTNIGAYMWSTLVARDMGLIKPNEARDRLGKTINTLSHLEIHTDSGMYYNWYDPTDGHKLTVWPDGGTVYPFLSTVDNGWLATALIMVSNAVPQLRNQANAIVNKMDFGFYYDPAQGLLRGGFWPTPPAECSQPGNYRNRGPEVYYTCHTYGALNTEPRMASYIAIAKDGVPATHYFKMWRTFPDTCDWGWQEMKPSGVTRNYLGVDVYEGHYTYRGMNIVPSWGGSMFEALMVPLFVPEEQWGKQSWGVNHPLYVEAQIEHGLQEANYGYWGFSPSNDPAGGYREYGVDPIGLNDVGYTSDEERTLVDYGFGDCRPAQPPPVSYGQGVVTPHASFLALRYAPAAALANLAKIRQNLGAYGWGGFYDSVNVRNGQASKFYLALDQGMIMAAIGNATNKDDMRDYFVTKGFEKSIRPILQMEQFTAGN